MNVPAGTTPLPFVRAGMVLQCPFFRGGTWRVEQVLEHEPRFQVHLRRDQTPVATWKGSIRSVSRWTLAKDFDA